MLTAATTAVATTRNDTPKFWPNEIEAKELAGYPYFKNIWSVSVKSVLNKKRMLPVSNRRWTIANISEYRTNAPIKIPVNKIKVIK